MYFEQKAWHTNAWSKHAEDQEKEEPEQEESTSVGDALRNLSISVNSLKQATLILNQVNFFIKHPEVELKQLSLLETRARNDQRQNNNRGRFQTNQNTVRPRYQSFNNVQQRMSSFQQNPQQQMVQNFQQGYQQLPQANQQRKIQVSMFPCPLGCQHYSLGFIIWMWQFQSHDSADEKGLRGQVKNNQVLSQEGWQEPWSIRLSFTPLSMWKISPAQRTNLLHW